MWTRSCKAALGTAASSYEGGGVGTDSDSGYYTPVTTARLSRLGWATWTNWDSDSCSLINTHSQTPDMSNIEQNWVNPYLCLWGKSTCDWSMYVCSWSWTNSIVHRGANTPCLGWQQKYSTLSTNPPWRPTGLISSTPAHTPGWKDI